MIFRYKTTPAFRKALRKLSASQKQSAKDAFRIFKQNPFDPRLRTHKIHHLSALYKKTIYAVWIEADLRSVFYIEGEDYQRGYRHSRYLPQLNARLNQTSPRLRSP